MAAKTKINETGDCIFTEQDAIDILYNDPNFDISKLFFDDIKKYNDSLNKTKLDLPNISTIPERPNIDDFDTANINNWFMPKKYTEINVLQWLLDKCQTDEEKMTY